MRDLIDDWIAEQDVLDRAVADLPAERWQTPSPAEGWLLRDCAAHLAEVDEMAAAVVAERAFPPAGARRQPTSTAPSTEGVLSAGQQWARELTPAELLAWWREARARAVAALAPLDPRERLPWAGPPMSARSFVTARLMEYWAHGLDILEAAGVPAVDTDRLKHVAHLGYVTRDFAYRNRGLEPPTTPLYVELTAPSGAVWTWGPPDAPDRIVGPAGDFCRGVVQRIHWSDTALRAEGEPAAEFLRVAQAFAGPPGSGRPPKKAVASGG